MRCIAATRSTIRPLLVGSVDRVRQSHDLPQPTRGVAALTGSRVSSVLTPATMRGSREMHFGVSMFHTDYSIPAVELAQALEARGFESMWAPEHSHIPVSRRTPFPGGGELPKPYYEVMDPFVVLSAAAVATKTLKLATGVCLVVQRDPIQTAKLVASLDQVSGGRFLFGVGGGWNREEIEGHGTAFATRFKLMRERIAARKEIWTEAKPEYHGEFGSFPPLMTWPP